MPSEELRRVNLRASDSLLKMAEAEAELNNRSLNSEIVSVLTWYYWRKAAGNA